MNIVPSKRLSNISAYAFALVNQKIKELQARGVTPIKFGVGDYGAPTPVFIREAAKKAIDERAASGYPDYVGDIGFRKTTCDYMKRRFGVAMDPETEVCATIGSKEGVFNFAEGFVNPGDVVLVPSPGYPPFSRGTLFAEGVAHYVPLLRANGFVPDLDAIPADAVKRAKIMWINYPNSPTGAVLTRPQLQRIVDFCRTHGIILASDEAYSDIYFTDEPPPSALEFGKDGIVATFSMSKRSIMTGWRCGWFAGDPRIIDIFRQVKTNIDSGTPTFIQDASAAALRDDKHVEELRAETRKKRDLIADALVSLGLPDCRPKGTIFMWQKTPEGMSGVDFAALLIDKAHVVTTPGEWLGDKLADGSNAGAGHVRFALAPTMADCETAARRIRELKW